MNENLHNLVSDPTIQSKMIQTILEVFVATMNLTPVLFVFLKLLKILYISVLVLMNA